MEMEMQSFWYSFFVSECLREWEKRACGNSWTGLAESAAEWPTLERLLLSTPHQWDDQITYQPGSSRCRQHPLQDTHALNDMMAATTTTKGGYHVGPDLTTYRQKHSLLTWPQTLELQGSQKKNNWINHWAQNCRDTPIVKHPCEAPRQLMDRDSWLIMNTT